MITLVVLALVATALVFAAVPVIGYSLMLETVAARAGQTVPLPATVREPRRAAMSMDACFATE